MCRLPQNKRRSLYHIYLFILTYIFTYILFIHRGTFIMNMHKIIDRFERKLQGVNVEQLTKRGK